MKSIIIAFFILVIPSITQAGTSLTLKDSIQHLGSIITVLYDDSNSVTTTNVLNGEFLENPSQLVEMHNTVGNYWLRFSLKNNSNLIQQRILSFDYAHVKQFTLYEIIDGQPSELANINAEQSLKDRIIFSRYSALKFSSAASSESQYLLKVQLGHLPLEYDIKLYPVDTFNKSQAESIIFISVFSGFLLALLLYNASLYFSLRMPRYLYYCMILIMTLFTSLGYEGILYLLPGPISVDVLSSFLLPSGAVFGFFVILYLQDTLELKRYLPRLSQVGNIVKMMFVVLLLASIAFEIIAQVIDLLLLMLILVSFIISMRIYYFGNKAALHIAIAFLFSLVGASSDILILSTQNSIHDISSLNSSFVEWMRQYFYYICLIINSLFLSIALVVFVRQVRDEKDAAQQESLELLSESNQLKDNYANQLEKEIALATDELRKQTKQLEQLDQQKTRFFTNISHEFRTPLTLIKGPIMGLVNGEYGTLNNKGKSVVDICSRNLDHLSRLIEELLLLAELEAGSSKLKTSLTDINQFCRRTICLFAHTATEKEIQFTQKIPDTETLVYIDTQKLEKIIYNLLSNAFKYTPNGGEVVFSVVPSTSEEKSTGSFIDIKIEDTGPGICESEQAQIFDRFYRAANTDDNMVTGSGIGLALVKELVSLHGGEVSVSTREDAKTNTGSCFTVSLPLGLAHLQEHEIQDSHHLTSPENIKPFSNKSKQESKVQDLTLLIVEDNTDMRIFVVSQFDQDYHIIEAANGKQALECLSKHSIDLVISDVMMPEMDGIRLLENIRSEEKWQTLPVILLTAKVADEGRLQALRARADDYLAKPFNAEELKLKVENLLHRTVFQAASISGNNTQSQKPKLLTTPDNQFLNMAREHIQKQLSNTDFDVQALADAVHMSRSTLQRRIENEIGMTAAQFIRQIRLEQAHAYIQNKTHRTLAETAYAVGFNHPGYFSKLYKKYSATLA